MQAQLARVPAPLIVLLALAVGGAAASVGSYENALAVRGAAEMFTLPNGNVQLVLDEFDQDGIADGMADHIFILEQKAPVEMIYLSLPKATIIYSPRKLTVLSPPQRQMLWLLVEPGKEPAAEQQDPRPMLFGSALSHHRGNFEVSVMELAAHDFLAALPNFAGGDTPNIIPDGGGGAYCDAGGVGSNQCSIQCASGTASYSCSITCTDPNKYSCCNCSVGSGSSCKCFKNPQGTGPPGGG